MGLANGGYFVSGLGVNPTFSRIVGQRFDILGHKVGHEINLSKIAGHDVFNPSIAVLPHGGLAVAFVKSAGSVNRLIVHRYDSKMHLVGTDHIGAASGLTDPSITALAKGRYVISYTVGDGTDDAILANIVSRKGHVGHRFDVLNETDRSDGSEIAKLSNGDFVVAMQNEKAGDGNDRDIKYAIFHANGVQVGGVNPVFGTNDTNDQVQPDVAVLTGGGFVVVWTAEEGDGAVTPAFVARFTTIMAPTTGTQEHGMSRRWPMADSSWCGRTTTPISTGRSASMQTAFRWARSSR